MTNPSVTSLGVDRDAGTAMIALSRRYLREYLTKIRLSVSVLDEHVVWARPNEASNSIGNLMLHLAGNARQWICAGIGGEKDVRNRDGEFSVRGGLSGSDLIAHLKQTVEQATATLAGVTADRLLDEINPQTGTVSVLEAIYQVVGHFQQHTGQIVFATKILAGEDLGLYRPTAASK